MIRNNNQRNEVRKLTPVILLSVFADDADEMQSNETDTREKRQETRETYYT